MSWKKTIFSAISILLLTTICDITTRPIHAEPRKTYVVGQAYLQIRLGPGSEYAIIKSLPKGSAITLINGDIGGGYAEVLIDNRLKGYALKRYLSETPILPEQTVTHQSKRLPATINKAKRKSTASKSEPTTQKQIETLISERNQLANKLEVLRHSVENVLELERQRNELQERLVNLERNNRHLKLENQALQNKSSHDWFLLGAGVLFAGIIIGWLLSSIGQRRKTFYG